MSLATSFGLANFRGVFGCVNMKFSAICEIILIHISHNILDKDQRIDPNKIKLVGRLGADWYCKSYDQALFQKNKKK